MSPKFKRVWSAVTTVFVVLVVIIAILLVGVRLVGIQPYTVLSGSMEPTYHVGSLIYVWTKVDPTELKTGDPVTFMMSENTVATHRIIEVIPDESDPTVVRYRTKGDANEDADGALVHSANVIGKPIFTIPYMGYFANYVQQPPGKYVALTGCILLLIAALLPDLLSKKTKKTADGEKIVVDVKAEATADSNVNGNAEVATETKTDEPSVAETPAAEEGTKTETVEDSSAKSNEE